MREDVFPPFEKINDIKIEPVQMEAADLPQVLEAQISAGKVNIDLFAQDNMQLSYLAYKNLLEDLSPYEEEIPQTVIPALIEAGKFKNKLFYMPYRPNVQITYYNAEKFDQYKLKPPRNWDELLKVAKVFKKNERTGKILFKAHGGAPTATQLYEWIVSAGGDPLSINDSGCVKTFTFLKKLWPYCSPDSIRAKFDTSNEYLARDSAYLTQNWPFGIRIIVKDYKKEGIKTYHGFSGPVKEAHVVGGEVLGIPKGSPNKELALKFIKYLQSRKVQEKLVSRLGWPSIRTDAYGAVPDWMKPHFRSVSGALKFGIFRKNVYYWNSYVKYINEAFSEIVVRGQPVKRTLDFYRKQLDASKQRI
ncbi:MAG: extracellular solute-binding protein [Candidatus Margulisiibacteriota bacterium]|nr:extracellular solute-binding protein [Candidatus Margulisiibacteriota bacterium]